MPIRPIPLGVAGGLTAALVSTVCAAFLAISPRTATTLLGLAVHHDLSGLALVPEVTWASYLTALFFWGIGTGVVIGFAAVLYDRMSAARQPS